MGFREDLDLSGFIEKYRPHLAGESTINYVGTKIVERDPTDFEPIPAHLYESADKPGSGEDPEKVGTGPLRASTCRFLALARPTFCWDANRYYRSLGIPWPYVNATRGDISRAYQKVEAQENHWLMYCLKQLINPKVREAYDATPLGKEFLADLYVQQRMKHAAFNEAHRRTLTGDYTTTEEILDERGYVNLTAEEEVEMERLRAIDAAASSGKDGGAVGGPWQYAFYLWRTTSYDRDLLAQWQEALIREVAQAVPTIAVGMMAKQPHRFVIAEVQGETVLFLNRSETITPDLVAAAATALIETD